MTLLELCKDIFNKEKLNKFFDDKNLKVIKRKEHAYSVYLMGMQCFKNNKSDWLIPINKNAYFNFEYFWRYLSKYYDIGYSYQKDKRFANQIDFKYFCKLSKNNFSNTNWWHKDIKIVDLIAYYYINLNEPYDEKEPYEHGMLGSYIIDEYLYDNPPIEYSNKTIGMILY